MSIKLNLLLFLLILGHYTLHSQNPTFDWIKNTASGSDYQALNTITSDPSGHLYATGSYNSFYTVTFNNSATLQSPLAAGAHPSFLVKLDAQGTVLWEKDFETEEKDILSNLKYHNNALYVTGRTGGQTETVEGISISEKSAFILKYDTSGTLLWIDTLKTTFNYTYINDITLDNNDNIYITGSIVRPITVQGTSYPVVGVGSPNTFVIKYNSSGVVQWVEVFGSTSYGGSGNSIACDNMGGIYVAGTMRGDNSGPMQFGNGISFSTNTNDFFLAKLNESTGSTIWVETASSTGTDFATSVVVGANGFPHVAGYMAGANGILSSYSLGNGVSIDAYGNFSSIPTGFIIQYDTAGTAQWARRMGGAEGSLVYELDIYNDTIAILGDGATDIYFENTADTISVLSGTDDFNYIATLTTNGTWLGARPTTLGGYQGIFDIHYNTSGELLAAGKFEDIYYYGNDSVVAVDDEDAFLAKVGDLTPFVIAAPSNLMITNVKNVFLSPGFDLAWQDNASNEEGFLLYYLPTATPWLGYSTVDISTPNQSTYSLNGLSANEEYELYLVAYASAKEIISPPSNLITDSTGTGITTINHLPLGESLIATYPNPAVSNGHITIEVNQNIDLQGGTIRATLVNLNGQQLQSIEWSNYTQTLSLEGLVSGHYFLFTEVNNRQFVRKIIIK